MYDAIIIPGGGLTKDGRPHSFVQARLKKAWNSRHEAKYFITLSRGTTHLPPKLDQNGYEIDECKASARYLYSLGDIKKDIIEHLWKVIISDNSVDQYESNLMRRICGLIYFPDKESAEIKLKLLNSR